MDSTRNVSALLARLTCVRLHLYLTHCATPQQTSFSGGPCEPLCLKDLYDFKLF